MRINRQNQESVIRLHKLKERLKIPHYAAVGIVTILKVITANGRRLTVESLNAATDWDGSPDQLYDALIESGLLIVAPERNN